MLELSFSDQLCSVWGRCGYHWGRNSMTPDSHLLNRYATDRDEAAFAELVQRHLNHVYSTALRLVGGDVHLAEDVAQAVFSELARKASSLSDRPVLSGWLHTTARFMAAKVVRTEQRRRQREQTALTMPAHSASEPGWDQIRAFLDDSIGELSDPERDAVMLRYFEKKLLIEVGLALGISEDAARMRVGRAVEKLRQQLATRGIVSSAAALAKLLAAEGSAQAPLSLCSRVCLRVVGELGHGHSRPVSLRAVRRVGILGSVVLTLLIIMVVQRLGRTPLGRGRNAAEPAHDVAAVGRVRPADWLLTRQHSDAARNAIITVVADSSEQPIANATVRVQFVGPANTSETREAMTDVTGSVYVYEPKDPAKHGRASIHILAEGYVPISIRLHDRIPPCYRFGSIGRVPLPVESWTSTEPELQA